MGSIAQSLTKLYGRITEEPMADFPFQFPQLLEQISRDSQVKDALEYPGAPLGRAIKGARAVTEGAGAVAPALAAFTKGKYGKEIAEFIRSSKVGGPLEKKFLERNFNQFLEYYPEKALDYMKWEHVVEPEDALQILGSRQQPAVGEFWAPKLGRLKSQFVQNYYDSIEKFKTPEAKEQVKKAFEVMEQTPGMFTNSPYGSGGIFDAVATKIHELMHNLKYQSHKGSLGMKGRQLEEKEVGQMEQELTRGRHSELFEKSIAEYNNLEREKAEYFARKLQQSR